MEYSEDKKFAKLNDEERKVFEDVKMLRKQGKHKEARNIARRFPDNPIIQTQIASIIGEKETLNTILEKINNNPNDATINDEIEQLDDKWLKVILNSALGEKMNMKMPAQQFIKKMEKQGYIDEEYKPIISALKQRLEKKSKIFDMEFYENLITKITDSKDNMRFPSQDDEERI